MFSKGCPWNSTGADEERTFLGVATLWRLTPLPRSRMLSQTVRVAALVAVSLSLAPACAGPQRGAGAGHEAAVTIHEDGSLRLDGARALSGLWELVPASWPERDLERPVVGIVRSGTSGHIIPFAWRSGLDPDNLRARRIAHLGALPDSKLLLDFRIDEDDHVTLQGGRDVGVALHDLYFVLDDPFRADPAALLQVTDVSDTESVARVVHARRPMPSEQTGIAQFMELRRDAPQRPATVAFAGLADHPAIQAEVSSALQAILEEFSISNLGLIFPEASPAPDVRDAERAALQETELEGTGFLVFVRPEAEQARVNVTGFGENRRAHLVGILPGGLTIPVPSDAHATLADELVALAVPAALAIREEHALALYVTWWLLDREPTDAVLFHLREHLALRLDTLGRTEAGLELMEEDVRVGVERDDPWIERNAVSIRAFLHNQIGQSSLELEDARRFLELTRAADPDDAVYRERLHVAIAERAAGETEASLRNLEALLVELMQAEGDASLTDVRYASTLHYSIGLALAEDPADALLVLSSLDPVLEELGTEERAQLEFMRLELLLHLEDTRTARQAIEGALARLETLESLTSRAGFLERLAWVVMALDDRGTAMRLMIQALELALQDHNYLLVAEMLQRLGNLQLDTATRVPPEAAVHLLRESRQSFHLGSELLVQLGRTADAAGLLVVLAAMEYSARNPRQAHQHLERAETMALSAADAHLMLEILSLRGRMAREAGDDIALEALQQRANRWAELAGASPLDLGQAERQDL